MGDRYFLKIGNGDRWEITKEEYDEGHKLMRLVQDVEFELKDAQATIRTLTAVVEQGEQHVEQRDARIGELAADKLELNAQLREARQEVEALRQRTVDLAWQHTSYGADARFEALEAEIERLRTVIRELGAGEAAEPPDVETG